ncbi:hypothetical protein [Pseudomonas juntendi]|uniref:Lipoprotein n=1 Tax=Pseudomonas juntendi TaxID=2666183 RepID=A0AAJ5RV18_9PSED|nr:hypothetical protein [Pseudomonas juntendi]WEA19058.1 hypothetical protein PWA60_17375 [Pseudomonas juntendi]
MFKKAALAGVLGLLIGCAGNQESHEAAYTPFTDYQVAPVKKLTASELAGLVQSLGGGQGKYETDRDYQARMSKIPPFEVCKNVSENYLKFDQSTGNTIYKEFLSEAQVAGYREVNGETFSDARVNFPSLEFQFTSEKVGEFVGQNAFGATSIVDVRFAESVHLVLDPMRTGGLVFPHPFLTASAPTIVAAGTKLCVTVAPVGPFYRESVRHASPTVKNPNAGEVKHMFFRVKIGSAKLVDQNGVLLTDKISFDPGIY